VGRFKPCSPSGSEKGKPRNWPGDPDTVYVWYSPPFAFQSLTLQSFVPIFSPLENTTSALSSPPDSCLAFQLLTNVFLPLTFKCFYPVVFCTLDGFSPPFLLTVMFHLPPPEFVKEINLLESLMTKITPLFFFR